MPKLKLKTSKSALKRFKISARGKIRHRSVGINHFNAKTSGNETRRKRSEKQLSRSGIKGIKNLLPYNQLSAQ